MNFIYYFMITLTILPSQNLKTSMDEKTGDPMIVGIAQRSDLTVGHYGEWFEEEYSEYGGDEELITASKYFLKEIEVIFPSPKAALPLTVLTFKSDPLIFFK